MKFFRNKQDKANEKWFNENFGTLTGEQIKNACMRDSHMRKFCNDMGSELWEGLIVRSGCKVEDKPVKQTSFHYFLECFDRKSMSEAINAGALDKVKDLLNGKVNPNGTYNGKSYLAIAANLNNPKLKIMELLLKSGAENIEEVLKEIFNLSGNILDLGDELTANRLNIVSLLVNNILKTDVYDKYKDQLKKDLRYLLNSGKHNINVMNKYGPMMSRLNIELYN
jgi:hypothetical protein